MIETCTYLKVLKRIVQVLMFGPLWLKCISVEWMLVTINFVLNNLGIQFIKFLTYLNKFIGVFALNGLLYVMGGKNTSENDSELESAEVFDPNTNTWTLLSTSINCKTCFSYCYVLNNDLKYYRNKP